MTVQEAAGFIGMDPRRLERMAQKGDIPCQKVGGQYRFNRAELTEWLQQRMVSHTAEHYHEVDAGMSVHREMDEDLPIIAPLMRVETISPHLPARTRKSVLKELVALGTESGLVYDGEGLLEALNQREELCSTAMEEGIAIPHPRRPMHYAIAEPFVAVGITSQGIGFGAPDGGLTNIFFLTCTKDDRHHLHVLARLCRMLHNTKLAGQLRQAENAADIMQIMRDCEELLLKDIPS